MGGLGWSLSSPVSLNTQLISPSFPPPRGVDPLAVTLQRFRVTAREVGVASLSPSKELFSPPLSLKFPETALARATQWVGHHPTKQKVAGSIPGQAYAWVVDLVPSQGAYERQQIHISLSH